MINISVVIPTLNEVDSLPSCLSNLAGQMRSGDEVIVVDAGSEDGTIDLAKKAGCRTIIYEDSSIGEARGLGAREANGEVIATTDADTLPPKGWVDRIRKNFEADDGLVVLWGSIEDRNGVPIRNLVGKFSTLARGASGNNTAYRKKAFMELENGYPDISFMEDVFIINRLSQMGKAKRDKKLVMVMNMDRQRYQTLPIVAAGMGGVLASGVAGGKVGRIVSRASMSMIGTEAFYEGLTESPMHHDEFGMTLVGASRAISGDYSTDLAGLGAGMVAHHAVTEGISKMPTKLMQNTDKVV
jgi:glycosyltransferase involved in cell wall biosynthesis